MSIVVSLFAGWVLLIGITFAIQNYAGEVGSATGGAARPDLHRRARRDRRASCCC